VGHEFAPSSLVVSEKSPPTQNEDFGDATGLGFSPTQGIQEWARIKYRLEEANTS